MTPLDQQRVRADEVVELDDCLALAERLQHLGHQWHLHVLSPGCTHNPFPRYALIIEDDQEGRVYSATSDDFPSVDRKLVRVLHGSHILDSRSTAAGTGAQIESPLLVRVRGIDWSGQPWHHHMCFPTCAINPYPGRWVIEVESGGRSWNESWEAEPVGVLRELEVMVFSD